MAGAVLFLMTAQPTPWTTAGRSGQTIGFNPVGIEPVAGDPSPFDVGKL